MRNYLKKNVKKIKNVKVCKKIYQIFTPRSYVQKISYGTSAYSFWTLAQTLGYVRGKVNNAYIYIYISESVISTNFLIFFWFSVKIFGIFMIDDSIWKLNIKPSFWQQPQSEMSQFRVPLRVGRKYPSNTPQTLAARGIVTFQIVVGFISHWKNCLFH